MRPAKSDHKPTSFKQRWQKVRRRAVVHAAMMAFALRMGFYFLSSSQIALLERQAFALKSVLFGIRYHDAFQAARDKILLVTIDESTSEIRFIQRKSYLALATPLSCSRDS